MECGSHRTLSDGVPGSRPGGGPQSRLARVTERQRPRSTGVRTDLPEIQVGPEQLRRLAAAFDEAFPRECCGVLLGEHEDGRLVVRRVLPTLNAASLPGGFAIPDHELRRARLIAEGAGLRILAIFHSHPGGAAALSSTDRAALAGSEWPWVVLTRDYPAGDLRLRLFPVAPGG
jgi:proteasome lid subunit RPN8/RPN11